MLEIKKHIQVHRFSWTAKVPPSSLKWQQEGGGAPTISPGAGLPDTYTVQSIESESIVMERIYHNDYRDLTPFSPKLSRPPYFIASGVEEIEVSNELCLLESCSAQPVKLYMPVL